MKQILIHLKRLKFIKSMFFAMKLEINNNRKYPTILELNNTFLANPWVKEELMKKIQNDHKNRGLKYVKCC